MDLLKLAEPFDPADIDWRIGQAGKGASGKLYAKVLAYLTNRAIMQRLDDVCGPANWRNEYRHIDLTTFDKVGNPMTQANSGVLCGLSIFIQSDPGMEGHWVTKWDGAENTDIEGVKGGLSDAMKRAAVQWGIGRYLYNLGDTFADCTDTKQPGWNYAKAKDGTAFWWKTPTLPAQFLPKA